MISIPSWGQKFELEDRLRVPRCRRLVPEILETPDAITDRHTVVAETTATRVTIKIDNEGATLRDHPFDLKRVRAPVVGSSKDKTMSKGNFSLTLSDHLT